MKIESLFAVEHFKRLQVKDYSAIIMLAIIWIGLSYLTQMIKNPQTNYMIFLLITTMCMTLIALLINKVGAVTFFYGLGSVGSLGLQNLGGLGWSKVIVFILAGVVFELVFLLLKIEIKLIPLDIVLGAGLSNAAIPLFMSLLLATAMPEALLSSFVNLIFLSFIIGIIGSLVALVIWFNIRTTRLVLKFEFAR